MTTPEPSTLARLRGEVRNRLQASPRCHDWDHTERVTRVALELASEEGADPVVVECAALLHDVGRAQEGSGGEHHCHADRGAAEAGSILHALGVTDSQFVEHVSACVRTHRFRKREEQPPASLEARVVYDADKLDALGAIGIGRAFHFAGRIGARVHNTDAEALQAEAYSTEDTAYREFLVKLRHLPDAMLTPSGRRRAVDRHAYMTSFFQRLAAEAAGEHNTKRRHTAC
jgi:uncharacterized protein